MTEADVFLAGTAVLCSSLLGVLFGVMLTGRISGLAAVSGAMLSLVAIMSSNHLSQQANSKSQIDAELEPYEYAEISSLMGRDCALDDAILDAMSDRRIMQSEKKRIATIDREISLNRARSMVDHIKTASDCGRRNDRS